MPNIPYLLYFPLTDIPWEVYSYTFLEFLPWVVLGLLAILSLVAIVLEVRDELNSQKQEIASPCHHWLLSLHSSDKRLPAPVSDLGQPFGTMLVKLNGVL